MVPSVFIRPWFAITLLAGLGLFLFPLTVAANVPRTCAPGIIVKLSAPASTQGSLLLLEVRSRTALSELTAEWNSRNVPFWQLSDTRLDAKAAGSSDVRQAILGVDLEKPPGTYPVLLRVQSANGKAATCTLQIPVRAGKFATEKLQVGKEFVEPSPEQIQRANEERDSSRRACVRRRCKGSRNGALARSHRADAYGPRRADPR